MFTNLSVIIRKDTKTLVYVPLGGMASQKTTYRQAKHLTKIQIPFGHQAYNMLQCVCINMLEWYDITKLKPIPCKATA